MSNKDIKALAEYLSETVCPYDSIERCKGKRSCKDCWEKEIRSWKMSEKKEETIPIKTVAEHLKKRIVGEDKCLECHQADNDLNCTECWEEELRSWKDEEM